MPLLSISWVPQYMKYQGKLQLYILFLLAKCGHIHIADELVSILYASEYMYLHIMWVLLAGYLLWPHTRSAGYYREIKCVDLGLTSKNLLVLHA